MWFKWVSSKIQVLVYCGWCDGIKRQFLPLETGITPLQKRLPSSIWSSCLISFNHARIQGSSSSVLNRQLLPTSWFEWTSQLPELREEKNLNSPSLWYFVREAPNSPRQPRKPKLCFRIVILCHSLYICKHTSTHAKPTYSSLANKGPNIHWLWIDYPKHCVWLLSTTLPCTAFCLYSTQEEETEDNRYSENQGQIPLLARGRSLIWRFIKLQQLSSHCC